MLELLLGFIVFGSFIFGICVEIYYRLNKDKFQKRKGLDDDYYSSSNNYNNTNISTKSSSNEPDLINPTTGALMVGGFAGVDTFGNSFGSDVVD